MIRPLVVDPHTGETPEEQELARATQRFLDALAARAEPGVETAEGYNPPEASDDGSGPHSSDGADGEETHASLPLVLTERAGKPLGP